MAGVLGQWVHAVFKEYVKKVFSKANSSRSMYSKKRSPQNPLNKLIYIPRTRLPLESRFSTFFMI